MGWAHPRVSFLGFFDWLWRHWDAAIFCTYSSREARLPVTPYLTPT